MVSVLWWVLAGVLVYTVVAMALRDRGVLPEYVKVSGPITTLHTIRGKAVLDRLARPKRFWRAWANFGVGAAIVSMVGMSLVVASAGYNLLTSPERTPDYDPQHVLVIPGFNEFLPLSAAHHILLGLLIGLVVHEGGHGLLCRVENIDIDSMGLALFTLIPVGAFVEPDEEGQLAADRGSQTRMFAAGVTNNYAISVIAFLLLFGPVAASIAPVSGAGVGDVIPGSSADDAGLGHGDVITGVNGTTVENASQLDERLAAVESSTVEIGLRDGETVPVDRRLVVMGASPGILDQIPTADDEQLPRIRAVNGTEVRTEAQFASAVGDRTVMALETDTGTATLPVGAYVSLVRGDGAFADAGAPSDARIVITRVGDHRVAHSDDLGPALDAVGAGADVTVEAFVDGERETFDVTVGTNVQGDPALGIGIHEGYSSVLVDDFGIDSYPTEVFLGILGGGSGGLLSGLLDGSLLLSLGFILVLPFATLVDPTINYNFFGFIGDVTSFFVVTGPLEFLGAGVFVLGNVAFWTGWINFNLAIFNCIPAFPLDGGHILRTSVESVLARLPIPARATLATAIVTAITIGMLLGIFAMVFGPMLLN